MELSEGRPLEKKYIGPEQVIRIFVQGLMSAVVALRDINPRLARHAPLCWRGSAVAAENPRVTDRRAVAMADGWTYVA